MIIEDMKIKPIKGNKWNGEKRNFFQKTYLLRSAQYAAAQ